MDNQAKKLQRYIPPLSQKDLKKWQALKDILPHDRILQGGKNDNLLLFHGTPGNFESFYPLSHFGTLEAAREAAVRSDCFVTDVPTRPVDFKEDDLSWPMVYSAQNVKIIPVCLNVCRPLIASDIIHHDSEHYKLIVCNELEKDSYTLLMKCRYPILKTLAVAATLMDFSLKSVPPVYQMIFDDPYRLSNRQIAEELALENLYKPLQPYSDENDEAKLNARVNRQHLILQRMIRFLEGRGYDGIQYVNRCEDKGNTSYIVFRPEQVVRLDRELPLSFEKHKLPPEKEARLAELEKQALNRSVEKELSVYEKWDNQKYQKKLMEDRSCYFLLRNRKNERER